MEHRFDSCRRDQLENLFAELAHRLFQAAQREWVHALAHQLLHDADALAVLPHAQGLGVDPSELGGGVADYLEVDFLALAVLLRGVAGVFLTALPPVFGLRFAFYHRGCH